MPPEPSDQKGHSSKWVHDPRESRVTIQRSRYTRSGGPSYLTSARTTPVSFSAETVSKVAAKDSACPSRSRSQNAEIASRPR